MPEDNEPDWYVLETWFARAKRKNRTAQLKRSINKYRDGTNLPFYCHELHAYKKLQALKRPGKKATFEDWAFYIHSLKSIHCHVWQAIHQAEREQEQAKRKEQK